MLRSSSGTTSAIKTAFMVSNFIRPDSVAAVGAVIVLLKQQHGHMGRGRLGCGQSAARQLGSDKISAEARCRLERTGYGRTDPVEYAAQMYRPVKFIARRFVKNQKGQTNLGRWACSDVLATTRSPATESVTPL